MITGHDSFTSPPKPRWRYPVLFGMQTIGAVMLLWNAVPLYQQILADPAAHEVRAEHLVWALSSIVLMQVGYWISDRAMRSIVEKMRQVELDLTHGMQRDVCGQCSR